MQQDPPARASSDRRAPRRRSSRTRPPQSAARRSIASAPDIADAGNTMNSARPSANEPEQKRQAVPRPARETRGHRFRAMTPAPHEHRADQHDERREEDQLVEPRRVDREAVVEEDERHREDRAAGGRDVGLRDVRIARDHVMQVDEVALRELRAGWSSRRRRPPSRDLRASTRRASTSANARPATDTQSKTVMTNTGLIVKSPCKDGARRRSRRGCCAWRCSRRHGTAGSGRCRVLRQATAAARMRTACARPPDRGSATPA